MKKQSGFTLVELTVVLIIVSVLLGGILIPLSSQADMKRRDATTTALNNTKDAINGYLMINGKVPCPAVVAIGPESVDAAGKCTAQTGFIPTSLGMQVMDDWGRPIRYSVAKRAWSIDDTATIHLDTVTTEDALTGHFAVTPIPTEKLRTDLGVCSSVSQFSEVVVGVGIGPIVCAAPEVLVTDKIGAAVWSDGADAATDTDNIVSWTAWPTLVMHSAKHLP